MVSPIDATVSLLVGLAVLLAAGAGLLLYLSAPSMPFTASGEGTTHGDEPPSAPQRLSTMPPLRGAASAGEDPEGLLPSRVLVETPRPLARRGGIRSYSVGAGGAGRGASSAFPVALPRER